MFEKYGATSFEWDAPGHKRAAVREPSSLRQLSRNIRTPRKLLEGDVSSKDDGSKQKRPASRSFGLRSQPSIDSTWQLWKT